MEKKLNYLQVNLENNYKDEAWRGYHESAAFLEELKQQGVIPEKQLKQWEEKLKEYARRMQGYGHHENLLNFD